MPLLIPSTCVESLYLQQLEQTVINTSFAGGKMPCYWAIGISKSNQRIFLSQIQLCMLVKLLRICFCLAGLNKLKSKIPVGSIRSMKTLVIPIFLNQLCCSSHNGPKTKGKTNLVAIEYDFYYANTFRISKQAFGYFKSEI